MWTWIHLRAGRDLKPKNKCFLADLLSRKGHQEHPIFQAVAERILYEWFSGFVVELQYLCFVSYVFFCHLWKTLPVAAEWSPVLWKQICSCIYVIILKRYIYEIKLRNVPKRTWKENCNWLPAGGDSFFLCSLIRFFLNLFLLLFFVLRSAWESDESSLEELMLNSSSASIDNKLKHFNNPNYIECSACGYGDIRTLK